MYFESEKERFYFHKLPSYLFVLLPLSLVSGPFISDFSISLISFIFLIYCFVRKNFKFFKKKYFYIFLFFWVYLLINSLTNNYNITSLKISFFYFRFGVFVIAIYSLLKFDDNFLKLFFYCLLFSFSILIADGFYQYFLETNIFGIEKAENERISSLFGEELILGSYLSRLWPVFFALGIFYFNNNNRVLMPLIIIFILAEVLVFLSGERTAFFYINLSAFFVILFSTNLKKLRLFTLILSLLLIFIVGLLNPAAKNRMIDRTIQQMTNNKSQINEKVDQEVNLNNIIIFSKQHTHHYITAYKMFIENKILGVGVKNFRNFCDFERYKVSKFSCSTHPHNSYLQILSETGLLGFMYLLIIIFYFIFYLFIHVKQKYLRSYYFNDFEICILSGLLISIWPLAPTGNVFNNWLNIIYYLYVPILLWSLKKRNLSKSKV